MYQWGFLSRFTSLENLVRGASRPNDLGLPRVGHTNRARSHHDHQENKDIRCFTVMNSLPNRDDGAALPCVRGPETRIRSCRHPS